MKIIQIRGCHGVGKSTAVRQFIEKHGLKETAVEVGGKKVPIQVSEEKDIVVLGRYNIQCGGCDLFHDKEQVLSTIKKAIEVYRPEIIIFEGVMYGATKSFSMVAEKFAKKNGYAFVMIYLHDDFEKICRRIQLRNGGKDWNLQNTYSKFRGSAMSTDYLIKNGYDVRSFKTSEIEQAEMYKVIEGVAYE